MNYSLPGSGDTPVETGLWGVGTSGTHETIYSYSNTVSLGLLTPHPRTTLSGPMSVTLLETRSPLTVVTVVSVFVVTLVSYHHLTTGVYRRP